MALSVGVVYRVNLERKGHRPFVAAARHLPDVEFVIAAPEAEQVAEGVRRALELGPEAGERARRRVLEHFPYEMRRDGICHQVELALGE